MTVQSKNIATKCGNVVKKQVVCFLLDVVHIIPLRVHYLQKSCDTLTYPMGLEEGILQWNASKLIVVTGLWVDVFDLLVR